MNGIGKRCWMLLGLLPGLALGCGDAVHEAAPIEVPVAEDGRIELLEGALAEVPEGTPGEDPAAPLVDKARNCSYVQWCNEPGPRGTICRARSECGCSGVIECNEEVRAICGGFVDPAYFLCPGQP
jgi:hypothetical protein